MKVLRFEVWRESTKVTETKYEGPLTREEALGALQAETSLWIGKLTVKYSPDGPRGPRNLDSSETYVLQLAGREPCSSMSKTIFHGLCLQQRPVLWAVAAYAHPASGDLQPCPDFKDPTASLIWPCKCITQQRRWACRCTLPFFQLSYQNAAIMHLVPQELTLIS